jgi:hypothetical protein
MTESTGLLGFGLQLAEFESKLRSDRIYVGGHFNLPDMLAKLGKDVRCRGISLTRSPAASMSSAIRYVWTKVEQGDRNWSNAYPSLKATRLGAVRNAATLSKEPTSLTAMRDIALNIMQASEFQENYADLLEKYYYNHEIKNPKSLQCLFADHPELAPSVDAAQDEDLICAQLRIDGPVPRLNTSLFPHPHLARAFGGDDEFHAAIAPSSPRSSEIYGALCVLHTLKRAETLNTASVA